MPPTSKHMVMLDGQPCCEELCHARNWAWGPTGPCTAPGDLATLLPSCCWVPARRLQQTPGEHGPCRLHPVAGSMGSAAHTGLFIVGSRAAGAPWQRHSLCQSWRQDGHLHGDPVHISGWVGGIYLFAGLFSLVIKQPASGTATSLFWGAAGHGSSGESRAEEGVPAAWQGCGTQPGMPPGTRCSEGGVRRGWHLCPCVCSQGHEDIGSLQIALMLHCGSG